MNRVVVGIIVLVLFILGGAFFFMRGDKSRENPPMDISQFEAPEVSENLFSKAEDVLPDFSNPTACTYNIDAEGGATIESKIFIDGKKFRSEYVAGGQNFVSVSDGQDVYSWQVGASEGMKINLSCLNDLENQFPNANQDLGIMDYDNPKDFQENATETSCQEVSDIDISVPENIEFIDQCELIKSQIELLEGVGQYIPSMEGLDVSSFPQ